MPAFGQLQTCNSWGDSHHTNRGGTAAPTCTWLRIPSFRMRPVAPTAYLQVNRSRPFVSGTDDTIGPLQKRAASFFPWSLPLGGAPQSPAGRGSNGAI